MNLAFPGYNIYIRTFIYYSLILYKIKLNHSVRLALKASVCYIDIYTVDENKRTFKEHL